MCFFRYWGRDVRGRELTYMATYPRTEYICTSSFRISFSLHSSSTRRSVAWVMTMLLLLPA